MKEAIEILKECQAKEELVAYFEGQIDAAKNARRGLLAKLLAAMPKDAVLKTKDGFKKIQGGNGGLVLKSLKDPKDAQIVDVSGAI